MCTNFKQNRPTLISKSAPVSQAEARKYLWENGLLMVKDISGAGYCWKNKTSQMKTCTNGYSFKPLKTVCLLFAIRLSSVYDWWDAVQTNWIICSEKNPSCLNSCTDILLNKLFIYSNGWGFLFEKNILTFERLRISKIFICLNC